MQRTLRFQRQASNVQTFFIFLWRQLCLIGQAYNAEHMVRREKQARFQPMLKLQRQTSNVQTFLKFFSRFPVSSPAYHLDMVFFNIFQPFDGWEANAGGQDATDPAVLEARLKRPDFLHFLFGGSCVYIYIYISPRSGQT